MKIGLLTSSRADFGIYYPLVKRLWEDNAIVLELIVFGTHLKKEYGYTVNEIEELGFEVKHRVKTQTENSAPINISNSIGDTIINFSEFWNKNVFDLVFALGDRYEMFAAVSAASPFNIDIAHIHAGETTLGAIDNAYRHSISSMSKYLFVTTEVYRNRAMEINNTPENAYNVGALSIDNLKNQELYTIKDFYSKYNIDLNIPSILSTFHPETVSLENNIQYIEDLINAFKVLKDKYQIIITMPNSDTMGDMIREKLIQFGNDFENIKLIESFGMKGYLSCMKYSSMLIGNTSSGFVEAAFFPKWVINIGDRQKGRIVTDNILNVKTNDILATVDNIEHRKLPSDSNIYGNGSAANKILMKIKSLYGIR